MADWSAIQSGFNLFGPVRALHSHWLKFVMIWGAEVLTFVTHRKKILCVLDKDLAPTSSWMHPAV